MILRKIAAAFTGVITALSVLVTPSAVSADLASEMDSYCRNYGTCCVQVYNMDDGENLYSHRADSPIFCASVIKLPYAVYVCHQITEGKKSLDDTFTYTSGWYHAGSGIIKNGGYGKVYTVRQLLDYMLRYSDNVAYDVLVYMFGTSGFNSMVKDWGYSVTLGDPSPRWPYITSSFMTESMKQMAIHHTDGECWETAWDALTHSTDVMTRANLGDENREIAIKYGQVDYVYHEVCYIGGEHPYILVILTSTSGWAVGRNFFRNAAQCADKMVSEYIQNRPVPGDVNNDGTTDLSDLVHLRNFILTCDVMSLEKPQNADMNSDGAVNINDFRTLMKQLVFVAEEQVQ